MGWVHAAVVAWCGIIGGDCVLYHMGRRYGMNITRVPFVGKHVTKSRIVWAELKFEQWGVLVVAVGRMFAGIRGAMVVAAGITRFKFYKFVIADGLAAIVSGGLFMYLGYLAGKHFGTLDQMREDIHQYEKRVVGVALVIAIGVAVWYWWHKKRKIRIGKSLVVIKDADIVVKDGHGPASPASPAGFDVIVKDGRAAVGGSNAPAE
jgi:membrane protein DedA with SNARE-associated domain